MNVDSVCSASSMSSSPFACRRLTSNDIAVQPAADLLAMQRRGNDNGGLAGSQSFPDKIGDDSIERFLVFIETNGVKVAVVVFC